MRKWLALALCTLLALSLCCLAAAEDLPEPFAHITFDGEDEGYTAITNGDKEAADEATLALLDGANKSIVPAEGVTFRYGEGPVGKALFLDGTYGIDLGIEPTNTDAWTVSFWLNASRLSDYGPTLQIGYNIGRNDQVANVTWMNVTQTNWTPKYFPTVWSRNVASGSWPWMAPFADGGAMIGKREWALFTIVCSGEEQNSPVAEGTKTVGAKLYVNGELRYDSQDNYENGTYFAYTWDATLAPNIMKPDEGVPFEAYFGVNYWDTIFKGYVDDLYVFDTALTAEQVAALYALGNAALTSDPNGPAEEAAAEAPAAEEPAPAAAPVEVVINGTAVGATTLDTPFWGAHSDIWEVPEGQTVGVLFTNYNPGEEASNWNNFNVVLQNTPTGHSANDTEGYAEYAVVRSDNYGWGTGYETAVLENDYDWDNFCANLNGATVLVLVTNNGGTADVAAFVTPANNPDKVFQQTYTGITTGGPLYYCLVVDNCCLDIVKVLSAEEVASLIAE
ncbi:MAG: hypothetical protein IKS31_08200 [Clostridia bacterium]|nr:hypothetical protein [Clostridia bacterium]